MKLPVVVFVLLSVSNTFALSTTSLAPIRANPWSGVVTFFDEILRYQLRESVGGACFFGPPNTSWWQTVRERSKMGRDGFRVFRLCDGAECLKMKDSPRETQCALVVANVVKQQMEQLSRVPYWTHLAVHLLVWEDSRPLEGERQITSILATFGVTRVLLLSVDSKTHRFSVQLPVLFERKMASIDQSQARRSLFEFNQVANLHGFRYQTLYYTLVPYLYRYDGVFGGSDYRFLETVLAHQNATHQWIYHVSTDSTLNSSDLHYVDRKLLRAKRVAFSLNRLLLSDANDTVKLYLNTFDGTCVLVPRKPLQTFILKLWEPFSQHLWYTVLAILMAAILGNLVAPRLFAVNYILAVLFGSKLVDYRLRAFDRAVLSVLDVLVFLLKEAYTAKIITYMIQTKYEPELETLEQLASSGLALKVSPGDYPSIRERVQYLPHLRTIIRDDYSSFNTSWREYFHPSFAHVVPCSYGRALVISDEMHEPDAPQYYLLHEKLRILPEAFTFLKRNPLVGRLRFFVRSLSETGIYGSWFRQDHYAQDRTLALDEILRFENLASLFYVLLVGYAAAIAVFAIEFGVSYGRARAPQTAAKQRANPSQCASKMARFARSGPGAPGHVTELP
uniref:Ionotropic glutamate receptor L-glutamate and glycine-binding domain-containing protein n=1 Tax=Anopheles farauti TaxID=69004 RepID=A0A182QDP7_9DIPT